MWRVLRLQRYARLQDLIATGAEVIDGVETTMTELSLWFSGDVAGGRVATMFSTGLNASCGGRRWFVARFQSAVLAVCNH